jgi:hypothetical protein
MQSIKNDYRLLNQTFLAYPFLSECAMHEMLYIRWCWQGVLESDLQASAGGN